MAVTDRHKIDLIMVSLLLFKYGTLREWDNGIYDLLWKQITKKLKSQKKKTIDYFSLYSFCLFQQVSLFFFV